MLGSLHPDFDFQRKLALDQIECIAAWSSILLLLCGCATAAAGWDWLHLGGHWYPIWVHAARLFFVMGIFASTRTCIAQKYPCTMMKACVIPIAMISVSIILENPEVEVHYHAISRKRNMQQTFDWLEHVVPAAQFDAILAAASKAMNSTSMSDAPFFPMNCIAQEMRHGTRNALNNHCCQHEGFTFNLIMGHAFLLSTALHSGLTCRCCMASWLLSQLASVLVLSEHNAPSLNIYFCSIATFMLVSFFVCLLVSLWIEWRSKRRGSFCACSPSTETQQATESQLQSGNLLKIQFSNGIQATCSSEHEVLIKEGGAKHKGVKAGDLPIGVRARTLHASEETIAAVTVQPSPHGVVSLGLANKKAIPLAVDPQSDMAIPVVPEVRFAACVDCWGMLGAHTLQVAPHAWSSSESSSPIHSDKVWTGQVELKL